MAHSTAVENVFISYLEIYRVQHHHLDSAAETAGGDYRIVLLVAAKAGSGRSTLLKHIASSLAALKISTQLRYVPPRPAMGGTAASIIIIVAKPSAWPKSAS